MTIKPVDLQVIIPRVTEVSKTQHVTDHQDVLQQQQFAEQWQKISGKRQKQVQSTVNSEEGKVNREKNPKEQSNSRNRQKDQDVKHSKINADIGNHASSEDPVRGNLIDIKT